MPGIFKWFQRVVLGGSFFLFLPLKTFAVSATGGAVADTTNGYRVHTFTSNGVLTVTASGNVAVLVVAGGGGGGQAIGGGGGAGGVISTSVYAVIVSNYAVTVGAGGAGAPVYDVSYQTNGGSRGSNSSFGPLITYGGGGGGSYNNVSNGATAGGSGGGIGAKYSGGPMAGTNGQGNAGGITSSNGNSGAGGGGAGSVGSNATSGVEGAGGAGISTDISGITAYYGGGGGGGARDPNGGSGGAGGVGGGGSGSRTNGANGLANTGGGGGGGGTLNSPVTFYPGGTGGSGIVIVRYEAQSLFIENRFPTNMTTNSAWLNGYLLGTGQAAPAVSVYWGDTDGGAPTSGLWKATNAVAGSWTNGAWLSFQATGLTANCIYYYRYYATNSAGAAWAESSERFLAGYVTVTNSDPLAMQPPPSQAATNTGLFTIQRDAAATNTDLTVYYAWSGTAVQGTDYTLAPAGTSIVIAAGRASTNITITPLWNGELSNWSKTVWLTLQGGGYGIGSPASNVVTITNNPAISPVGTNITTTSGNWNGAIWSLGRRPIAGDAVLVLHTVSLTNTTESLKACAVSNATLRFDVWTNYLVADDIWLQNAGVISHSSNTDTAAPWAENAGVFLQCSNLTIESGGRINVDYMGYQGVVTAAGSGPGGGGYDARGGGGGHGGAGGSYSYDTYLGGVAYGSDTNPMTLGSAGGGQSNGRWGGAGGGFVMIVASGNVAVNGTGYISANGDIGYAQGSNRWTGAGAGGGINIQCATLSGTGIIRANGAHPAGMTTGGGGGGGGRIAIYATGTSIFSGAISADAGDHGEVGLGGGGGSIYISAPVGSTVGVVSARMGEGDYTYPHPYGSNSPGRVSLPDWSLLPATLSGGGARITAPTGVIGSLTITNYQLFLEYGWETNRLRAGNIVLQNAGNIRHLWNSDTAAPWTQDGGMFIECVNLTIENGGGINADGVGFLGGTQIAGYGPGYGSYIGGGGGYGGAGGNGPAGALGGSSYYSGSDVNPTNSGSGAGGGTNSRKGGAGGGYVKIVASGTVTVNGTGYISANGADGIIPGASRDPGGGSGGGINIRCSALAGNGVIRANGGSGDVGAGGGGGGGRIAIYATSAPFYTSRSVWTCEVNGGVGSGGGNPGAKGTIYLSFKPRGTVLSTW